MVADANPIKSTMGGYTEVNKAFSKQSVEYDADDNANPILLAWRKQVYEHVNQFLPNDSHILELNPGTGIDACHFVNAGHHVHCVELSDGMVRQIKKKIEDFGFQEKLTVQQNSYENLDLVEGKFDYVFSNFGGLNCTDDLTKVTRHLSPLLNKGAIVTWVIMPPICPWEIMWLLKGYFKQGLRRFHKKGVMAHLEGEYFKTYYYSLSNIKRALGKNFKLLQCEGLGVLSPPPSAKDFPSNHPRLYDLLVRLDKKVRLRFPFNRWGDHIIVTFQYSSDFL
jgi:ubiquinone/menaquinone biosynthesis C-methylase UbiE